MVVWIVLGVLVLFFAFACYKSTNVWNGGHIALGAGVFVMSLVFMFLAAISLRTHQTWMEQHAKLSDQLEQAEQRGVALQKGSPFDPQSRSESIEALGAELNQLVMLRGRAWRNLIAQISPQGEVILGTQSWGDDSWRRLGLADANEFESVPAFPADDGGTEAAVEATTEEGGGQPAAAPAVAGKPHGIEPQLVVYAFAEAPLGMAPETARNLLVPDTQFQQQAVDAFLGEDGKPRPDLTAQQSLRIPRVPYTYLGEFRVVSADPTGIKLASTSGADAKQLAPFTAQNNFTWVLFDKMPQDGHAVFAGAEPEQLQTLFAWMRNVPPASLAGRAAEYLRDGQDAQQSDPPARRWAEVKFVKPYKVDVDVEGEVRLPDRPFDPSGRAMESSLWADGEGPLDISEGQQGFFDPLTAQTLVRSGVAELVREVFVRKLRDYDSLFRSLSGRITQSKDQTGVVQRELQVLEQTLVTMRQQSEYRSSERDKLRGDIQGIDQENTILQAYIRQVANRLGEVQDTLKTLYQNNQVLVSSLPQ